MGPTINPTITTNTVAAFEYTLADDAGTVIDTSKGHGPMTYLHGAGNVVPGLEAALTGRSIGETVQAIVPPDTPGTTSAAPINMPRRKMPVAPGISGMVTPEYETWNREPCPSMTS